MIQTPELLPGKWLTMLGWDGAVHTMPTGEEHEPHVGCICNPIQYIYFGGGMVCKHRSLAC